MKQAIVKSEEMKTLNNIIQNILKIEGSDLTELRDLIEMEVIPVKDATYDILINESNNIQPDTHAQTIIQNIFNKLPKKQKNEILQYIASLTLHVKKNTNTQQIGGDDEIIEFEPKRNSLLTNKNLYYAVLFFIFGLSLFYYASTITKALGEEYGLDINFTGFVSLFLNPLKVSGTGINTIINSIMTATMDEMKYKISHVCSTAGNSWVGELLTMFQDPATKLECGLNVGTSVLANELELTKTKVVNNIGYITNLVRAGYAITFTSGARVIYIVNSETNGKLTGLLQNIPIVGKFVFNDDKLAITDKEGGKRKSKQTKKKLKKSKKSKKSKKLNRKTKKNGKKHKK